MADLGLPPGTLATLAWPVTSRWASMSEKQLAAVGRAWANVPSYSAAQERRRVYRILVDTYSDLSDFLQEAIPDSGAPHAHVPHTGSGLAARAAIVAAVFRAHPTPQD